MTDMTATQHGIFGTRATLLLLMVTYSALAQDADVDDTLEPAVDTSAVLEDERDSLEPGVTSSVLAQDVTRDESGSRVMDSIELGRTEITGNQELPKVLYIVPWQRSDPEDLMGRPINSLLDEVLAPLDREEFLRQVNYYDDLYGNENE